jgi:hypothetical protein
MNLNSVLYVDTICLWTKSFARRALEKRADVVMDIEKLKKEIEKQREEMTLLGLKYGLTDTNTVKSSQELDKLLNRLQFSDKIKIYNS